LKTRFNLPGVKRLLLPRPKATDSLDASASSARALFGAPPKTTAADRHRSLADFLKQVSLFEYLGFWELRRLARIVHERDYRDGEYIVEQGKPGAGAILFGTVGMLLAIPAMTVSKVLVSSTARQLKINGLI
jgi:hypothetical protein